MKLLHMVAFVLLIIGGLNWGLSAFGYNVVHMVVGSSASIERVVYILVGLSALYIGITHKSDCRVCGKK